MREELTIWICIHFSKTQQSLEADKGIPSRRQSEKSTGLLRTESEYIPNEGT